MNLKQKLEEDSSALKILKKARFHLMTVPYLLFAVVGLVFTGLALYTQDPLYILSGYITGILCSQLYWSRMIIIWQLEASKHEQSQLIQKAALQEELIYPKKHWLNALTIKSEQEKQRISF